MRKKDIGGAIFEWVFKIEILHISSFTKKNNMTFKNKLKILTREYFYKKKNPSYFFVRAQKFN